ncbi:CrcB-like protein-domain-containing protein [Scheffersomyces xylosifermentans]|uniref:CrcB-like protein-domain-containing protein n=1 Tax=Scheffersomyces xylosifermentans TaxID=1304137 RepID=UPI00315C5ECB
MNKREYSATGVEPFDEATGSAVLSHRRSVENELQELEAVSLQESLPEGFNVDEDKYPSSVQNPRRRALVLQKTNKYYKIILNITNGAIWGVLARKGLMQLTTYNGSYLGGVIWANFAACIVMGIGVDSLKFWSHLLDNHPLEFPTKAAIPLYTGLTTGFCGTLSSFSSVMLEAFNKSADTEIGVFYNYPNSAYGIMEFFSVMIAQFGLSVMGFHIGKHFVEAFDDHFPSITRRTYKILETVSMLTGVIGFIIAIILIGVQDNGSWRSWMFAVFFAPFGALLRFYLSKYLNAKVKDFPLGTFSANFLGSLLLAIFTLLGRGRLPGGGQVSTHVIGCHVLNGLDDGFCGALTTVSTFIVELFGLKTVYSYRYGFVSIILGYLIFILIPGSYNWAVGLTDPICV